MPLVELAARQVGRAPRNTHVPTDGLENQPFNDSLSKTWHNPKKRPSTSNLFNDTNIGPRDFTLWKASNEAGSYPQKRSRAAEWPLRSTDDSQTSVVIHRPATKASPSPGQRRNPARKSRPSKFLEGSMNDRVSKKPPSIYLRDEAAMEQYHDQASTRAFQSQDTAAMDDDKTYYEAGIEVAKPSGMYRFGKALASAFNPANVWQGINGYWKMREEQKHPDKNLLQERKIKAERTYAEMKKNGLQVTQPFAIRGSSIDGSGFSDRTSQARSMDSSLRDSGGDFNIALARTTRKNEQPAPAGSEDMLIATSLLRSRRAASPIAQAEKSRRTSLNLRRPSIPNLKKVRSQIHLASTKRQPVDAALVSPSSQLTSEPSLGQKLSRQPSKRDIAKQRKLSKQVSDLECKLQTARRELEISRGQMPDTPKIPRSARKPFEPGALPTLLSGSHLDSRAESFPAGSDSERKPPSHGQNSASENAAVKGTTAKPPQSGGRSKGQESTPTSSDKKREVSGGRIPDWSHKNGQNTDNGSDSDCGVLAKKASRVRKLQNTDGSPSTNANGAKAKQAPVVTPKGTWRDSPKSQIAVPPVPTFGVRFDPGKVDQKRLLAMRSVPKDNLPFGSHLDDILNLQKAFPHCSQTELDEYLSSLSKNDKAASEPTSATKRASCENMSARARQPCKNSSPNRSIAKNLSTIDEAIIMLDPSKDTSIPPLPRTPMRDTGNPRMPGFSRGQTMDKALPEIQKEDYKWPEDVF
ncbi:MAG: hypothetical protein L6R40_004230 [Gallowayella cf. fulva]|nr:MAG: hypothetical protein L6R40_004230 [Xanthomendoza cf. fulva]